VTSDTSNSITCLALELPNQKNPLYIPLERLDRRIRHILLSQQIGSRVTLGRSTPHGFEAYEVEQVPIKLKDLEKLILSFEAWKTPSAPIGHKRWAAGFWVLAYLLGLAWGSLS